MKQRSWLRSVAVAVILLVALVLVRTLRVQLSSPASTRWPHALVESSPLPPQPPRYRAQRIPDPPGMYFMAHYLNDEGQVLGGAASRKGDLISNAMSAKAAVWDGQRFRMIPSMFAIFAEGLNNRGEILVNPEGNSPIGNAAASRVPGAQPLPSSLDEFRPTSMNNRGQTVGFGQLRG